MIWIEVTPRAARRVRSLLARHAEDVRGGLRLSLAGPAAGSGGGPPAGSGGGPGDGPYLLSLVTSGPRPGELALPRNGFDVLVAAADGDRLDGVRVDFIESDAGSGFLVDRPAPSRPGHAGPPGGGPAVSRTDAASLPPVGTSPELERRVAAALDDVRPVLVGDGGDVDLVSVTGGAAYIRLQGACSGCGSALATLTHLIESTVASAVPEVPRTVLVA